MKKISSFTVDHDRLIPGIYVSRIDGDIVTYDLRMRTPNAGDYITPLAAHSLEHLLATYMRAGECGDRVIYVGPMGCRTGFYLLMSGGTEKNAENFAALCNALDAIMAHSSKMPGAARRECGNFRALSLPAAKREAARYLSVLDEYRRAGTLPTFEYEGGRSGI
jgi:S-ribosylhomocysteine lyase